MIKLWNYQDDIVDQVLQAIRCGIRKILVVSPTGSGKSVIMGGLLQNLTSPPFNFTETLVVVPFSNLRGQIEKTMGDMGITVQTETYHSACRLGGTVDVMILDEAHHALSPRWKYIPEFIENKVLIGFTATPYRVDECPLMEANGGLFEQLVMGPDAVALAQDDFLANLEYYSYPPKKVVTRDPIMFLSMPISWKETITYEPDNREDRIVEEYVENFNGMVTIVFCKTVNHAREVTDKFNGAGLTAGFISCYEPKSRNKEITDDFKRGRFNILATCNMGSEGLDVPKAKLGIMARPIINSTTLFLQQCGRLLRYYKGEPAKVLDLVGNYVRFGHPNMAARKEII